MNDETFYEHAKKCVEGYGLVYNDEIKDILERGYKVFQWRDNQTNKCITSTKFKNHIEFTLDTFQELNKDIQNDGYIKLFKRCKYLLNQLDIYLVEPQKVHPKIENYFNKKFCTSLPTPSNILALIYAELKKYFGSYLIPNFMPSHLKEMISEILNKGKPFQIKTPRYRQIILTIDNHTTTLQNHQIHTYPTTREVTYTYSQDKFRLK